MPGIDAAENHTRVILCATIVPVTVATAEVLVSVQIEHDVAASRLKTLGVGLTEAEQGILEFERQWWKHAGAKEQAIADLFGMSATRYYQTLNGLIDRPEALLFDPMLVKRMRRLRDQRQKQRSLRRLGADG